MPVEIEGFLSAYKPRFICLTCLGAVTGRDEADGQHAPALELGNALAEQAIRVQVERTVPDDVGDPEERAGVAVSGEVPLAGDAIERAEVPPKELGRRGRAEDRLGSAGRDQLCRRCAKFDSRFPSGKFCGRVVHEHRNVCGRSCKLSGSGEGVQRLACETCS